MKKPDQCSHCHDKSAPIYKFTISVTAPGWQTTRASNWLCALCHQVLIESTRHFDMEAE